MRFSNLDLLDKVAPRRPGWKRHVVAGGYLLALGVLVVAVAQPQAERAGAEGTRHDHPRHRHLAVDAGDRRLPDPHRLRQGRRREVRRTRFPAKLQVGLVSFSGSTSLLVPPSTDRGAVTRAIKALQLDEGTAIGDAVQTSLDAIAAVPRDEGGKKPPAVIVLLSDGKTTVGTPTEEAIRPATKAGVPVFTIAYGTPQGYVEVDDGTGITQKVFVPVDEASLANLSKGTGGQAFAAASTDDLTAVYDKLGSAIGYDTEQREITWKVLSAGLIALIAVGALSLLWFQRLP